MWRIHRTAGTHTLPWHAPREFGPLRSMRFDPHPDGHPTTHRGIGVHYNATDIVTAVAETFQVTRVLDAANGHPYLTGWRPLQALRLLDLTSSWAVRNGAASALGSAPRSTCRSWAGAIHTEFPDLDGLFVRSTMTDAANIVLWSNAAPKLPPAPSFHRPLTDPHVWSLARAACASIGYGVQL